MSGDWLRSKDEISEYPYTGTITRVVAGTGRSKDTTLVIYEGEMDEHLTTPEESGTLQTSAYIISIPLTKDEEGNYIIPKKGDVITVNVYGMEIELTVDNSEPSQLGGVSINATRTSWD